MPPRKTTPKTPTHHARAPYAPLFMVVIVALLTIGLLLIWRELPMGNKPATSVPISDVKPVPAIPATSEQMACEAARGKWVECGNPCHGKPGEVCITSCEPQCLCGGIAGWMCPANQTCTDYEPSATTPDALGVCRAKASVPVKPSEPVRERPSGMLCDDLNFICVDDEVENSLLASPFIVKGSGIAFESTINWRLLDGFDAVIEKGFVTANAPDIGQPGDFEIRAFMLDVPTASTGTLEVLEYSAKDGSPTHVVRIPVRLPRQTMDVRFYSSAPTDTDCSVVSEERASVVRSSLPVEASLRFLLAGERWVSEGAPRRIHSAIPAGTQLISLKVSGGTATVVLSPELQNYGGGSCNVQAIRAQIETTLKQFSSVNRVEIIQQGKTAAETLQP